MKTENAEVPIADPWGIEVRAGGQTVWFQNLKHPKDRPIKIKELKQFQRMVNHICSSILRPNKNLKRFQQMVNHICSSIFRLNKNLKRFATSN